MKMGECVENRKISVIIPTHGRSNLLPRAIKSVLNQTYENIEIIVVDDNDEGSEESIRAKKYCEDIGSDCVKYISNSTNHGASQARNKGVDAASGEIIAFLDDDDYYFEDYINVMYSRMNETNADMVYMGIAYCDDGKNLWIRKNTKKIVFPQGKIFKEVLEGKASISIFFIINKEVFCEIGGFSINLKSFEDGDLWFKVARDYQIYAINDRLAAYSRDGDERLTGNPYNREDNLNRFEEYWNEKLSEEEKKLFKGFVDYHRKEIFENKILFELEKEEKKKYYDIKKVLVDILHIKWPLSRKIRICLNLLFREKGKQLHYFLKMKFFCERLEYRN